MLFVRKQSESLFKKVYCICMRLGFVLAILKHVHNTKTYSSHNCLCTVYRLRKDNAYQPSQQTTKGDRSQLQRRYTCTVYAKLSFV